MSFFPSHKLTKVQVPHTIELADGYIDVLYTIQGVSSTPESGRIGMASNPYAYDPGSGVEDIELLETLVEGWGGERVEDWNFGEATQVAIFHFWDQERKNGDLMTKCAEYIDEEAIEQDKAERDEALERKMDERKGN